MQNPSSYYAVPKDDGRIWADWSQSGRNGNVGYVRLSSMMLLCNSLAVLLEQCIIVIDNVGRGIIIFGAFFVWSCAASLPTSRDARNSVVAR